MKKIYIPSGLDLSKILEVTKTNELDKYHFMLHLIYEQRILYKKQEEYIPLKALYLRRIINERYETYRKDLIDNNIIECDRIFVKGEKSFGYRLKSPYSERRHTQVDLTNPFILKNIQKWQQKRLPNTDIHIHLYKYLNKIEIKYNEALNEVDKLSNFEYNSCKIAIDKLLSKDFFLISDDYGRVHTNITSLKSSLRKFLVYEGKKLVNIDIINSQPLLLLLLPSLHTSIRCAFSNNFESFELDLFDYKALVERGSLYDHLMSDSGCLDRGEFKEKFFRDNLFGKKVSKEFQDRFPSIASALLDIKKKDYRSLAWSMQRIESNLMINTICRRIMNEHPNVFIATIHDSILTTGENVGKVKAIILEEFKKLGLFPSIRVES